MTTIQTLARTKLESLKSSVTPPHFFKGIFEVTQFYAKFISISRKLLKMGHTEKAIEIAQLITDSKIKAEMIEEIAITLIARDDAEGAIQVINSNLTHNAKDKALYKIAVKLIEGNHTERAIQISESIFDPHVKESLLRDISQVFIREESLESAYRFINQISSNQLKFSLTNEIVKICLNLGEVDTAIESVCLILEGNAKDQALFCLARDLIMREKISERAIQRAIERAIEIAGSIDTLHWKTQTLEAALNALKIIIEEKNPVEF
jgi:lipopolysaccharide biosynthesis regulator YciM